MRRFRALLSRPEEKVVSSGKGFPALAAELVQEIFQYLRWPTDFYALSLVCRMLHRHATPKLYATLVIAYHRPARICALLELLERYPGRAKYVTTLLFDEDVKSIGPNLQARAGKWPTNTSRNRELTDGWDPASSDPQSIKSYANTFRHAVISKRLRAVLPMLCNLRCVVMRSLHPSYMYPGMYGDEFGPETPFLLNGLPPEMGLTSIYQGGIWRYIVDGSPHLTEIYLNGVPGGRLENVAFSALTTISISDLFYHVDGHADAARLWNTVLAGASNLHTLAMVQVQYVSIILQGLFFPSLEALELYMVYLCAPLDTDSQVFLDFLYRHSHLLRILALSCPLWSTSINHTRWLSDKYSLPELHTLRLNYIMALLVTDHELIGLSRSRGAFAAIRAQKTEMLFEFIRHRPKIVDVAIPSLDGSEADEFARFLTSTRRMRNVFIGETAEQSALSRPCRGTSRSWGYSLDAWAFYELFGGLTITKSGFRPRLPPRRWEFWRK